MEVDARLELNGHVLKMELFLLITDWGVEFQRNDFCDFILLIDL